ncbi:glycosyl transferase family 2 [Solitalea longa]|uniref:Glycosyl transferase family 2 n=1 Tax=Solitalea longa TaxID=2079460 RepID=A0A2S5A1F1_9SPHI|nr:glycosyltransferase [Solitalea longa]POY36411.1 glycosyl transferase family 2 [Solitalea longa]
MSESKHQVFQTSNTKRWKRFLWVVRLCIFFFLVLGTTFGIALWRSSGTALPKLSNKNLAYKKILNPDDPIMFRNEQNQSYNKLKAKLLHAKPREIKMRSHHKSNPNEPMAIRAGYYVNWDAQSFSTLKTHIDQMNMIMPEWFFVTDTSDVVQTDIDEAALELMKKHKVSILPMISNFSNEKWNAANVHRIISSPEKRKLFIASVVKKLDQYKFQGVNIDFEDLNETTDEYLIAFQKELYTELHAKGFLVTQDIAPGNADYNLKAVNNYNDYVCLMAYDQHYSTSKPGPIAQLHWIESAIGTTEEVIPEDKIILCLAAYGYDWAKDSEGEDITYQEALTTAAESEGKIRYNNDDYNLSYTYSDDADIEHQVFFTDAATDFNTMVTANEAGLAGVSLWRLGSEDPRVWSFYKKDFNDPKAQLFNQNQMQNLSGGTAVDYIGEGEVLDILSSPQNGYIKVAYDQKNNLITEQQYQKLPTSYVVKKFGMANKQVLLTFDDGPDGQYTPAILDILKKENVPAAFFMIGENAENNIPLVKQIYKEGYEIGNHTFTHPNLALMTPERQRLELNATRRLIECITGHSTVLFRPPFNADAEPQSFAEIEPVAMSKQDHYVTIGESIDPRDWEKDVSADTIFQRVVDQQQLGSIILLHDAGGNRTATIEALPRIIHYFKNKGYKFITVADLLGKKHEDLMPALSNSKDLMLSKINFLLAVLMFYFQHVLEAVFILGIILSVARMIIIGIMAYLQKRKQFTDSTLKPGVSIIVPAYNEEINAIKTVINLLKSDYPEFEVIFVDDGSKDNTYSIVDSHFYNHQHVTVLTKPNGGKASALNFGIAHAKYDYVVCIDADTLLKTDAITQLMKKFNSNEVVGVAGNVKVGNELNLLTKWQSIEYITAQNFDRRAFDLLNCITVIPGANGAFKKSALIKAGLFTSDTLAEDCDLTIRLLKNGGKVAYAPEAIAVTEAPETVKMFLKQRFRWTFGIMQSFWKHRNVCFNVNYKSLGMVAMPNLLIFQLLMPLISPLADLLMIYALIAGGVTYVLGYYLIFILIDALGAAIAFSFEKEPVYKLWLLIPQRFFYRQLMYFVLLKALLNALKGELMTWGVLKRSGSVELSA